MSTAATVREKVRTNQFNILLQPASNCILTGCKALQTTGLDACRQQCCYRGSFLEVLPVLPVCVCVPRWWFHAHAVHHTPSLTLHYEEKKNQTLSGFVFVMQPNERVLVWWQLTPESVAVCYQQELTCCEAAEGGQCGALLLSTGSILNSRLLGFDMLMRSSAAAARVAAWVFRMFRFFARCGREMPLMCPPFILTFSFEETATLGNWLFHCNITRLKKNHNKVFFLNPRSGFSKNKRVCFRFENIWSWFHHVFQLYPDQWFSKCEAWPPPPPPGCGERWVKWGKKTTDKHVN